MRDIKIKETSTKPKIKNAAVRAPKELMRVAILEGKEKSREIANARENDREAQSPTEYATGRNVEKRNEIVKFCAYYRLRELINKIFTYRKYAQKSAILIVHICKRRAFL